MHNSLIIYIKKIIKIIQQSVKNIKNKNKYKNIEKLELEILQYRKSVNEPENYDEKLEK